MPEATRRDASADILAEFGVSRETSRRIERIIETLDDWRARINLIGPREWPQVWPRHVADSLQLLDHIPPGARIMDFGSGAGFPGLIIAADRCRDSRITLIESVGKKCAYLRAAATAAGLPVEVVCARVESVTPEPVQIVTARAVAPLARLLELSAPWLENGGIALFPKGRTWHEELTAAQQSWNFTCEAIVSRTHREGAILKISEVIRHA
ncbi:MAG: 16S rRNA (guanine(527)-N(7))-methyltransferase RsmG [Alphaproteobacteria bacterium]|jgi:16S rRNA (guanine527-N7)-methyltransferase|nr:16S rRNA (guanine(527)-N(7))-methyltransferase RsmG [Alphaproteobacteria bacterium]